MMGWTGKKATSCHEIAQPDEALRQMWMKLTHLFGYCSPCDGVESLQPCTEAGKRGGAGSCWRWEAGLAAWTSVGRRNIEIWLLINQEHRGGSASLIVSLGLRVNRTENSRHIVLHCGSWLTSQFCCCQTVKSGI